MNCGGQGVYLWFLCRELARLGFEIDVFVGPPYPDPMPFARSVHRLPNQEFWAKWFSRDYAGMLPAGNNRRSAIFHPLNFYELAASRMGFLPGALRLQHARLHEASQRRLRVRRALGSRPRRPVPGLRTAGIAGARDFPVVTTVHHPLTSIAGLPSSATRISPRRSEAMQFYPIGMQSFVARRTGARPHLLR